MNLETYFDYIKRYDKGAWACIKEDCGIINPNKYKKLKNSNRETRSSQPCECGHPCHYVERSIGLREYHERKLQYIKVFKDKVCPVCKETFNTSNNRKIYCFMECRLARKNPKK